MALGALTMNRQTPACMVRIICSAPYVPETGVFHDFGGVRPNVYITTSNPLVGRHEELDLLAKYLGPCIGRNRSLLVSGATGIGKTALLNAASQLAVADHVVVASVGDPTESNWNYAALHGPVQALSGALAQLPTDQQELLAPLLGSADTSTARSQSIAAAFLSLLEVAGRSSPVLWCLDDAHNVDAASRQVVGFVARHIQHTPITLLLTHHEAHSIADWLAVDTFRLEGLTESDTAELVRQLTRGEVATHVARLIARIAKGNPLAVKEICRLLTSEQLRGQASLGTLPPVSPRLLREYAHELDRIEPALHRALIVVAVGEGAPLPTLLEALGQDDALLSSAALAWLDIHEDRCAFRAPIIRSLIYTQASFDERRRAHLALAAAYETSDPTNALWHRASATPQVDDELAGQLGETAVAVGATGQVPRALELLRLALRLSRDPVIRGQILTAAGRFALIAGQSSDALRYVNQGLRVTTSPPQRADLILIKETVRYVTDETVRTELIRSEADLVAPYDRARATRLDLLAARHCAGRFDLTASQQFLDRAERRRPQLDAEARHDLHQTRATLFTLHGRHAEALDWADPDQGPAQQLSERVEQLLRHAKVLAGAERWDEARAACAYALAQHSDLESPLLEAACRLTEAGIELGTGNVLSAHRAATLSSELLPIDEMCTGRRLCLLAHIATLRGHHGAASRYLDLARRAGVRSGSPRVVATTAYQLGYSLLVQGRLQEAEPPLAEAAQAARLLPNPAILQAEGDLVEVHLRLGETEQARCALTSFRQRAERSPSCWSTAVLARCTAMLGDAQTVTRLFEIALAEAARPQVSVLERARTAYCYGERLRRQGQRVLARYHLELARGLFNSCGAHGWLPKVEEELCAVGSPTAGRAPSPDPLTEREGQVVQLALSGATTREISNSLYISARTVEVHLSRIYRKLGIRSRVHLAQAVGRLTSSGARPPA